METSDDKLTDEQARWRLRCDELAAAHEAACAEVEGLRDKADGLQVMRERDQSELAALGDALLAAQDEAVRLGWRLAEATRGLAEADAKAKLLAGSMSFRLGQAIVTSSNSPREMLRLPARLWALRRKAPAREAAELVDSLSTDIPPAVDNSGRSWTTTRPWKPKSVPAKLHDLRIAAVMDDFTRACFEPACHVQSLHAARYEDQLRACDPHILMVESAWRGDAGSWRNKIASRSGDLLGLLDMCRRRGIPTVFWNKEDPSHFDTFLEAARLFDHVFTTDIDSIRRYRAALGHDRVHLLPFACQPRIHNPVVTGARQNGFCFAGSYYRKYPERCDDFDRLVSTLSAMAPVVIFDRNSDRGDPAFAFPPRYAGILKPALSYDRIDEAYKGYRFAVNLTTIKQSQTMFARRVYELLACNTITVSNYSRGLRSLFGELVIASDQPDMLGRRLRPLIEDPGLMRRHRLLALRKVLRQHTCERRVQYLAQRVLGERPRLDEASIAVVARVASAGDLRCVVDAYRRQVHGPRRLVLVVAENYVPDALPADLDAEVIRDRDAPHLHPADQWSGTHVAVFHPADYHGPNYLADLALATLYSGAPFIGKGACFAWRGQAPSLLHEDLRYRDASPLHPRACIARWDALDGCSLAQWLDRAGNDDEVLVGLAIDEYGYCRDGAGHAIDGIDGDIEGMGMGVDVDMLFAAAERLERAGVRPVAAIAADAQGAVNAVAADFLATVAHAGILLVAHDPAGFPDGYHAGGVDRFVCEPAPSRSFRERDDVEIMYGTLDGLRDLLQTDQYHQLWTSRPDQALCDVLRQCATRCEIRIRVAAPDLRAAGQQSDVPWVRLLGEGYPRIRPVLDGRAAVPLLTAILERPLDEGRCLFADVLAKPT